MSRFFWDNCHIITCHKAGPGTVNWKKFRALQTIDRVFPGAMGTLNEQIHITHFWSPTIGSFVSISILEKFPTTS